MNPSSLPTVDPEEGSQREDLRNESSASGLAYSVCMLCSNDSETVGPSVNSVLELKRYRNVEVVVVDNLSEDGSAAILRHFRDLGQIKLIEQSCSRGKGRQLAFDASQGNYIMGHMDCDDIFNAQGLNSLLTSYHSKYEGMLLMTKKRGSDEASNITIAPRPLLERFGGWRDLNWGEDWDLWARLASAGHYTYFPYPIEDPPHRSIRVRTERYSGPTRGFAVRVSKYTDAIKIGRRVFDPGEHISPEQRVAYAIAKARVTIGGGFLPPIPNPEFREDTTVSRVL